MPSDPRWECRNLTQIGNDDLPTSKKRRKKKKRDSCIVWKPTTLPFTQAKKSLHLLQESSKQTLWRSIPSATPGCSAPHDWDRQSQLISSRPHAYAEHPSRTAGGAWFRRQRPPRRPEGEYTSVGLPPDTTQPEQRPPPPPLACLDAAPVCVGIVFIVYRYTSLYIYIYMYICVYKRKRWQLQITWIYIRVYKYQHIWSSL